jgi:hypothetical protein
LHPEDWEYLARNFLFLLFKDMKPLPLVRLFHRSGHPILCHNGLINIFDKGCLQKTVAAFIPVNEWDVIPHSPSMSPAACLPSFQL